MTRQLTLLITALAACLALAAPPAEAKRDVAFGAWTPGSPFAGNLSAVDQLENTIGRRVKIVHWFQDFSTDRRHFRHNVRKAVRSIKRSGRRAMMTWEPYVPGPWSNWQNADVARGTHDRYIKRWARWMKKVKRPVYVRFAHEMNGDWYPWGGRTNYNSPKKFKRMWRHVVKVVREQGARNVKWVWSPLVEDSPSGPRLSRYYPGRKYVDVLGMSGFNWGSTRPEWHGWRSFGQVFKKSYKRIKRLGNQPVWVTETGSCSAGGDKHKWVRNMFRTARRWKRLKAIVWFNQAKSNECDWTAEGVASAFNR